MPYYGIELSPKRYARIAGALYVTLIVLGIFAELTRDRIASSNAASTAVKLISAQSLWRLALGAEFIALICVTLLTAIYFFLFRPVSKELNLIATLLRVVAIAIQGVALLNLMQALFPLISHASMAAFTPDQLNAMMALALNAHSYGYGLALLFFGVCFLVHGHLIFRSRFLPKVLGILIQIGGVCYSTNSLALFLAPAVANRIFPAILLPSFIAESSLSLWLLFKGVDAQKWQEVNAEMVRNERAGA